MIDVQNEQILTLSAAAREVPNRESGRGVNISTLWRWALRGAKGVKLETAMIGGVRMTSREALARFYSAVTAAANGGELTATQSKLATAISDTGRALEAAGI